MGIVPSESLFAIELSLKLPSSTERHPAALAGIHLEFRRTLATRPVDSMAYSSFVYHLQSWQPQRDPTHPKSAEGSSSMFKMRTSPRRQRFNAPKVCRGYISMQPIRAAPQRERLG